MVAENLKPTSANRLSDGFLPTWRTCPFCGSEDSQVMVGLANAGYLGCAILILVAQFILSCFLAMDHEGSPLTFKRRCRKCNGSFWPKPAREPSINCGQCDYDLTGNVSGICPECGWKIPPDIMAQVTAPQIESTDKQA